MRVSMCSAGAAGADVSPFKAEHPLAASVGCRRGVAGCVGRPNEAAAVRRRVRGFTFGAGTGALRLAATGGAPERPVLVPRRGAAGGGFFLGATFGGAFALSAMVVAVDTASLRESEVANE